MRGDGVPASTRDATVTVLPGAAIAHPSAAVEVSSAFPLEVASLSTVPSEAQTDQLARQGHAEGSTAARGLAHDSDVGGARVAASSGEAISLATCPRHGASSENAESSLVAGEAAGGKAASRVAQARAVRAVVLVWRRVAAVVQEAVQLWAEGAAPD